jgi:hypothetical protein
MHSPYWLFATLASSLKLAPQGHVYVPDTPGLGLTLDRGKLEKLKARPAVVCAPYLLKTSLKTGLAMYNLMKVPRH